MENFQELAFTAFMALVLSFVVAKIVTLAVCCYGDATDCDAVVCCVDEGGVGKGGSLVGKGLRVGKGKGKKKRVKFVDDVVVRRVDCYDGFESRLLLDDVGIESVGEMVGKSGENVDELELNKLNEDSGGQLDQEQCVDMEKIEDDKGCEKVEMLIEENMDEGFSEKVEKPVHSVPGDPKSVFLDEQKNEAELVNDDVISDDKEKDGTVALMEADGPVAAEEEEEEEVIDDDWEGIERSELEKMFAEAVNYVEYGGKGKDNDRLLKLDSAVQMQLHGFQKIALEGPCCERQPMALKVLARAKWNAWQRLGSMGREAAMEQYIRVLSDNIPGWMHAYSAVKDVGIHGTPNLEMVGRVSIPEPGKDNKV